MIDHSFESEKYGACYKLCKNVLRGYSRAQRALKLLKLLVNNYAVYQLLQKSYQSMIELMTVEKIHPKAPVMLIFIAIFTCLPSCINLSNIHTRVFSRPFLTFVEILNRYNNHIRRYLANKIFGYAKIKFESKYLESYKTCRDDRPLLREKILWSVLWAMLKNCAHFRLCTAR